MFATLKQLFNSKNKDIRHKVYFTLFCLFIFKLGTAIVVPGVNKAQLGLSTLKYFQLLNVMGGGALEQFSIFALGVSPYITASFIIQLLQMDIIPYLAELGKEGHTGQVKLNKITRYLGIVMAFVQGYMFSFAIISGGSFTDYLKFALVMTAGTSLLLWLADEITKKGIGNGVSLFIMAGIVNNLPNTFVTAFNELVKADTFVNWVGILLFVIFILAYLFILIGVVYTEISERRIPIQHTTRTASSYSNEQAYIPLKLNSANVMPVIFASALTSIPSLIGNFIHNEAFTKFVDNYIVYTSLTGFVLYILLIYGFGYVYSLMELNPKEMAENLDKSRAYIPGISPGERTQAYFKGTITRLTFVGSTFLAVLAAIPIIFSNLSSLSSAVTLGGTGLLIVVGVSLETYKQLESSIVSRSYDNNYRRRHNR